MLCFQYLEIEVKNPRTHIEKEKALYTDYEIELKVSRCFLSFESLGGRQFIPRSTETLRPRTTQIAIVFSNSQGFK